jgi:UDP:flavonoid glycosyltransferase YjiC (YdhE family)
MFPEQFRSLAEDSRFEFQSLGPEFIEMLDSPAGRTAMGGGRFNCKKLRAYVKLISMQKPINRKMIQIQQEVVENMNPDRIIHNGKVMYPVVWSHEHKNKTILVCPVPYLHYVKDHAHVMFNRNFGAFINKLTYKLANFGLIKTISGSLKYLTEKKGLNSKDIRRALFENKAIYTISPSLFRRPHYWKENLQVLGYHERKKTVNWTPSAELEEFIGNHDKLLLATFGSMINTDPKNKTKILLEALEKNNVPAIINTAAGGLIEPDTYNKELFFFVDNIPYDWVFPKVYGVVHHGGSGTTHSAIKYGCASLIIPHIIDQYVWNKLVAQKEVGPLGIDVSRISIRKLTPKINDLYTNPNYKKQAELLGKEMREEEYREKIRDAIIAK